MVIGSEVVAESAWLWASTAVLATKVKKKKCSTRMSSVRRFIALLLFMGVVLHGVGGLATPCPDGHCEHCPVNTYVNVTSAQCVPCKTNWFANGGSAQCTSVPPERQSVPTTFHMKLLALDGGTSFFGNIIAMNGDTVVVGAFGDDDQGTNAGAVYVFTRNKATGLWSTGTKLLAPDGAAGDQFGTSVAVNGNTIVVGEVHKDSFAGSVSVFTRNTITDLWLFKTKLLAKDQTVHDFYGHSVAVSQDTIVVGAYGETILNESGSAYVFTWNALTGRWSNATKLLAPDGAVDARFGYSVAVQGDTIVVGAYGDNDQGSKSGSAYVFTCNTTTESLLFVMKLLAPNGTIDAFFARSVALNGDTVVVGAPGDDDQGTNSGAVYVFTRNRATGLWSTGTKLLAPDGAAEDQFGTSVAVSGDTIVVGAPYDDDKGPFYGSVHIFTLNVTTGMWSHQKKLLAPAGTGGYYFGKSVALNGATLVGAAWGNLTGSVYTYGCGVGSWSVGTTCALCPAGTANAVAFTHTPAACVSCGPHDGASIGSSSCQPCKQGQYKTDHGECQLCPANFTGTVNHTCVPCPSGWLANAGDMSCTPGDTAHESICISRKVVPDFYGRQYFHKMFMGVSVAMSGRTILVGTAHDEMVHVVGGGSWISSVQVYTYDPATNRLSYDGYFLNPRLYHHRGPCDPFGYSVAIDGDTFVVGLPDYGSWDAAFVYTRNTTTGKWSYASTLVPPAERSCGRCGHSVSISGNTIVIGPKDAANSAAFVFERSGTTGLWSYVTELQDPDRKEATALGRSVSVSGGVIAAGAMYDDVKGVDSGSVSVYARNATTGMWSFVTKLLAPDGRPIKHFGKGVVVSGDTIVVRATDSVFAFTQDPSTGLWSFTTTLITTNLDGGAAGYYGNYIAMNGDTVVVGAPGDDDQGTSAGAVYVFNRNRATGLWSTGTKLLAPDGAAEDQFGTSVAVSGTTIVMGAPYDDDKGTSSGSIYLTESSCCAGSRWLAGKCRKCAPGTSSKPEDGVCSLCTPGSVTSSWGQSCRQCPAATYSPGAGATQCVPCPAGFSSSPASSNCSRCRPGTFSHPQSSGGICQDCPAGTISAADATQCVPCPAGFSSSPASSNCSRCRPGTFSHPQSSGGICEACASGTISAAGQSACSDCGAGSFSLDGSSVCSPCPLGQYSSSPRSGSCTPCPVGTFSNSPGSTECWNCPIGSYCRTGAQSAALCPPGQHNHLPSQSRCFPCLIAENCLGGSQCRLGYSGTLCGSCAPRYFHGPGEKCEKCPEFPAFLVAMLGIFLALIVGFLGIRISPILANRLRMAVTFMQCFSLSLSIDIPWPAVLLVVRDWFKILIFDLELASPECLIEMFSWHTKFVSICLLAGLIPGVILCATLAVITYRRKVQSEGTNWTLYLRLGKIQMRCVRLFFLVLSIAYIPLTKIALAAFQCIEAPGGAEVLEEDTTIQCSSTGHIAVQVVSVFILIFVTAMLPLGIGVYIGLEMYWSGNLGYRGLIAGLIEPYSPACPHFESVVMLRRALYAVFVVMFVRQPLTQAILMVVLGFVYLLIVLHFQPFAPVPVPLGPRMRLMANVLNCAEWVAAFGVLFTALIALISMIVSDFAGSSMETGLSWLVTCTAAAGLVAFLFPVWVKRKQKQQSKMEEQGDRAEKSREEEQHLTVPQILCEPRLCCCLPSPNNQSPTHPCVLLGNGDGRWLLALEQQLEEIMSDPDLDLKTKLNLSSATAIWVDRLRGRWKDREGMYHTFHSGGTAGEERHDRGSHNGPASVPVEIATRRVTTYAFSSGEEIKLVAFRLPSHLQRLARRHKQHTIVVIRPEDELVESGAGVSMRRGDQVEGETLAVV